MNVFDKTMDTCVQRFIRIECPGVEDEDIDWEEMSNGVKISNWAATGALGLAPRGLDCYILCTPNRHRRH